YKQSNSWTTYSLFFIVGFPANLLSLYVAWRLTMNGNVMSVYLISLCISDLGLTFTIGLSLWLDFLWTGYWTHGGYVCLLSVYSLFTNFYTSEALLCCIAVSRYLAVVHPLKYTFLRKINTAAAVTASIWVSVICFNASRFFLGLVIPVPLVFVSTWGTCMAVKSNQATNEEERLTVLKLLTVILLGLLFCFGPIHVMMLVRTQCNNCEGLKWFLHVYKISTAISSFNCLVDPLLYCFITKTAKAHFKQVLLFFLRKQNTSEESTPSEVQNTTE
uniref:G protein-coupled receptor 65 n=1 Tax=Nothobranchius furzeri TaxID=105023 RepID=A0A8C6Q2W9_NOTFU